MATETLQAWLIHKDPSGETSLRLTFFTEEKGLIQCFYKGGRSPKKKFYLQAFSPLWLFLSNARNSLYLYLNRVEASAAPLDLKGAALFAGLYVNELIFYTLKVLESHSDLFAHYTRTLKGLAAIKNNIGIEVLLRQFEWTLLQACGHGFSFTEDAQLTKPLNSDRYYLFIAGRGFVPSQGEQGVRGNILLELAGGNLANSEQLKVAKFLNRQAIKHLLGDRELKTRSYFRGEKDVAAS